MTSLIQVWSLSEYGTLCEGTGHMLIKPALFSNTVYEYEE